MAFDEAVASTSTHVRRSVGNVAVDPIYEAKAVRRVRGRSDTGTGAANVCHSGRIIDRGAMSEFCNRRRRRLGCVGDAIWWKWPSKKSFWEVMRSGRR